MRSRVALASVAIAAAMLSPASGLAQTAVPPLTTVPSVDLSRYAGKWYEIARYPNWFQRKCTGEVTANYTPREDGTIGVLNTCVVDGGGSERAAAVARLARPSPGNARLEVRFAPAFLSFLPFVWGDYWIIALDPDYTYAVVGDPSRTYLWILARSPQLDDGTYGRITAALAAKGYDADRLVRTPVQ